MNDDQTRPSNSALALPHTAASILDETRAMSDNNSNSGGNESEEEYEIERILNHQEKRFGRQRGAFPNPRNASDASHSLLIQGTSSNGRAMARQIIHG